MDAGFGWTVLSRDALRKAEARLQEETQGVRDEVGFLLLHQAYADRFFPGTSVLQTRLRYIFFVPWIYNDLLGQRARIDDRLRQKETALAGRLKEHESDGVIGSRKYPKPTSQPPSMIYWSALGTWGILRPLSDGSLPPRRMVHRHLSTSKMRSRLEDADSEPLQMEHAVFVGLPKPPDAWNDSDRKLTFRLSKPERQSTSGENACED